MFVSVVGLIRDTEQRLGAPSHLPALCWLPREHQRRPAVRSRLPPRLPARSFLGVSGREMDATWDDKGAGAAFFLQQEMSDAVTGAPPLAARGLVLGWPGRWLPSCFFACAGDRETCPLGTSLGPSPSGADMLRWVMPNHPTVQCMLREHGRHVGLPGAPASRSCILSQHLRLLRNHIKLHPSHTPALSCPPHLHTRTHHITPHQPGQHARPLPLPCRLVAQCEKVGLRRLHDDLQIHGQRLQDLVHEATSSKDG